MNWLVNKNIAHRGLHSGDFLLPENSLPAFEAAVLKNIPIELDVHVLKDNNLVVFHDNNLYRMTGVNKNIDRCTIEDISDLRLLNSEYKIPTLKEVLELVQDKVPILIELKDVFLSRRLEIYLIKLLSKYQGRYALQSFNPLSILWLKMKFPNIYRGQISSDFKFEKMSSVKRLILKNMWLNCITKPDFISYDINALPSYVVYKQRKKGRYIFGWTIKNEEEYLKAKKYCDSIIYEKIKI